MKNKQKNGKMMSKKKWVLIGVLALSYFCSIIGWRMVDREHREAANIPIEVIEFSKLMDGSYEGCYEGGLYKWRANIVKVSIASGRVTDITMISTSDPGFENADPEKLFQQIIDAQSLQIDTIASATLTSKGYLKGVENALKKAQR